jgi:glucans biosynthesis protein C
MEIFGLTSEAIKGRLVRSRNEVSRPLSMQQHRRDDLDNLRALLMLAGVLFHAALAYSPIAQPFFPTADRQHSVWVDLPIWFVHLFRMPVFFLIAGFFCALLVEKRGIYGMLAERARRIALVFVLFWPLNYLALKWSTEYAALTVHQPSPVLAFLRDAAVESQSPAARSAVGQMESLAFPPTTSHLWFLYYLMLFYLLHWCALRLEVNKLTKWMGGLSAGVWIGVMPLLLSPALAFVPAPHPAPESFLPQFWAISFYGFFFALGSAWYSGQSSHAQLIAKLARHATKLLAGSVLLYGVFLLLLDQQTSGRTTAQLIAYAMKPERFAWHWPIAICESYISLWMSIVCLSFAKRFLQRSSQWLRTIAHASYWSYLIHLPVLFVIQYQLMDLGWHWLLKWLFAVGLTLSICLVSYQAIKRPWSALIGRAK